MIPLRILRIGKFIETESRIGYQGPEGRMGSYCLVGIVSVWGDEKVLEMDSPDGCTTV